MDSRYESAEKNNEDASDRPTIMTLDEVADYLRVHRSTVYRMAREGAIPSIKVANQWRFHKDRIDSWLVDRERETRSSVDAEPPARRAVAGD